MTTSDRLSSECSEEAQRLRKISYQRQLEAGMKKPGRAGLTSDRLGDADLWEYTDAERKESGAPLVGDANDTEEVKWQRHER